jgi:hypothetical protein
MVSIILQQATLGRHTKKKTAHLLCKYSFEMNFLFKFSIKNAIEPTLEMSRQQKWREEGIRAQCVC